MTKVIIALLSALILIQCKTPMGAYEKHQIDDFVQSDEGKDVIATLFKGERLSNLNFLYVDKQIVSGTVYKLTMG